MLSTHSSGFRSTNRLLSFLSNIPDSGFICVRGFATGGGNVVELQSAEHYKQALEESAASKTASVFKFTAKWCGPCKVMSPVYEQLSREVPTVRFYSVDIDNQELQPAVAANGVVGVPNFSFYLAGEKVAAFRGAKKDQLLSKVQHLQQAQQQVQQQVGLPPVAQPLAEHQMNFA